MEEEKYQKELFEFEKPKRSFPRLGNIFPKPDFDGRILITFGLERLIFMSIGIIMLTVIVFALGVERGKVIARPLPRPRAIPIQGKVMIKPTPAAVQDFSRPYTIVAAAFRRKDIAVQELNKLKRRGLDATLVQSDSYFQVRVGAYPDKDSVGSQKALAVIRQFYKDAYFKLK